MRRNTPGLALLYILAFSLAPAADRPTSPPNVLFIAIDDLNDWVGSFGGSPQTQTPHLDAFCNSGATVFQNAYCPGPICGPSRSALLSGFMPNVTGIYNNTENMRRSEIVQTHATLPEYFAKNGYETINRGKIFHKHATPTLLDEGQWAFTQWSNTDGRSGVDPAHLFSRLRGIYDGKKGEVISGEPDETGDEEGTEFAWGPTRGKKEDTLDYHTAQWAAGELGTTHAKPFFLAVGIAKPHLPWYVPQEYFDRHPLASIKIPEYRLDDLDDILTPAGTKKFFPTADFKWVQPREELFRRAVQGYLAAASYADDCVGVVLEALANSKYRDNTIVVIFGDHGWHLGEKLRFRKATLWQEATRLPLMMRVPGISHARQDTSRLVNLMDLYKTLVELAGLPPKEEIDGRSLVPLLRNPEQAWPFLNVTINGNGNACVRDERWYYIKYRDGTEELYDMQGDPMQWSNLACSLRPEAVAAKARLQAGFPKTFAPDVYRDPIKKQVRAGAPALVDPSLKRDLAKLQ